MTASGAHAPEAVVGDPRRARRAMFLVAVAGLALDQFTKYLAVGHLDPARPTRLVGGLLSLELIRNPGAAFSLGTSSTVLISLLAVAAALAMVLVVAPRLRRTSGGVLAGIATAGITGNLVDRLVRPPGVLRGHVIDFFHLPHFAIFNVADIFITGTALWLVVSSLRGDSSKTSADAPGAGAGGGAVESCQEEG